MNLIYQKKRVIIDILFVTLVTNDELLEISTMLHVKYYEEHEMKVRVYQQYMHSVQDTWKIVLRLYISRKDFKYIQMT